MPSERPEPSAPLFVDTNIFVYAAGSAEDERDPQLRALNNAAKAIILALGKGHLRGVTSLIVFQEVVYLFQRWARVRKDKRLAQTGKKIVSEALVLMDEVYTPSRWEFGRALASYEPAEKDFNDLLIVEAMRSHDLREILTADRDYEEFDGIECVDPLKLEECLRLKKGPRR